MPISAIKYNPMSPSASLLAKLGSVCVHVQEYNGPNSHGYDMVAAASIVESDAEVQEWLDAMRELELLPLPRGIDER